ncbi:hypothetical protein K3495_g2060 [Podosphaera aphanis]|nr:hypothetical protein K3495_g2060 [Podosphaera aphanis]
MPRLAVSTSSKIKLQRLEGLLRQNGKLVYRDSIRDQIWVFRGRSDASRQNHQTEPTSFSEDLNLDFLRRETGIYEPSSLAWDTNLLNFTRTINNKSSPLSLTGNSVKKVQSSSAKFIQSTPSTSSTERFPIGSPRVKQSGDKSSIVSSKEIHEFFISAVLGSMMYFLCRDDKFIPFNSRTLISTLSDPSYLRECPNSVEFFTLDVNLTTLGTLVIKAYSEKATRLRNLSKYISDYGPTQNFEAGASLWLAPSGCTAEFYCVLNNSSLEALGSPLVQALPNDSNIHTVVKTWKSKCLQWLSFKGLDSSVIDEGGWVFAKIIGDYSPYSCIKIPKSLWVDGSEIVPWPTTLCFQNISPTFANSARPKIGEKNYQDPLSFAENWLISQDKRSAVINSRHRERQTVQVLKKEREEYAVITRRSRALSPSSLRRGSTSGNIYPTPPDAPNPSNGPLSYNDGDFLTSTNSVTLVNPNIDSNSLKNLSEAHTSSHAWVSHEKKHLTQPVNFMENYTDDDNNYGSPGGDIFGTNVTDADFNFFDEPDTEPMQVDATHNNSAPTMPHKTQIPKSTTIDSSSNKFPFTISSFQSVVPEKTLENFYSKTMTYQKKNLPGQEKITKKSTLVLNSSNPEMQPSSTKNLFSKEMVFNQVKMEFTSVPIDQGFKRQSLYNRVNFSKPLLSLSQKYGIFGRYNAFRPRASPRRTEFKGLPRTEYLSKRSKKDHNVSKEVQLARILAHNESTQSPTGSMILSANTDSDDQISQDDDVSLESLSLNELDLQMLAKGEVDRKVTKVTSSDILTEDCQHNLGAETINDSFIPFLDPDPVDWPTVTYFIIPEPEVHSNALSDLELVATTQILANQAISGTFKIPGISESDPTSTMTKFSSMKRTTFSLETAAKNCFEDAHICSFSDFLAVQGIHVSNQVLRLPPRPNTNQKASLVANARLNKLFMIPPPQLEVRRSDSSLSVLPAAVLFWANLGLSPSTGAKDVEAVCLYPDFDGIAANANIFLDRMRSVYESSRFGTHNRIISQDIQNGLVPFTANVSHLSNTNHVPLKEITGSLSRTLSSLSVHSRNLVIYFVYIVDDGALLIQICSAMHHLFKMYREVIPEKTITPSNEVVLQLVPLSFIASPSSLVLPLPSDYFRLGLEVYDRCFDFTSSSLVPAIILECPLPKSIDFRLNSKPSASLLQENTCLHIAYAQSIDNRWITVAWTDNRGVQQMTASYCLGRKNETISTSFAEVANEIWETTLEFISEKSIHWRLMIVRVGFMDSSEISFWVGLASTETNAQISLTLITAQTEPSLKMLPNPILKGVGGTPHPVSTTPTLKSSGSQLTSRTSDNALTTVDAPSEPDVDARIIDHTDQTWGAILSHRLNNSSSLVEVNLALISGYLIKRGGINPDDPPIVIEVNIVYSEVTGNPRTFHECLLKEILGYYRGLGTLARVRGTVDAIKDVRPWHIAAVEKAIKALYMLM